MARYNCDLGRGTTHTTNAAGAIYCPAASMRRIKIHYVSYGSETAPADQVFLININRSTTAPTAGTSVTPQSLDPADAACVALAMDGTITNGTTTANAVLLTTALNQKATFQWYAPPGGALVIPATASNGVHFLTPTASGTPALTISGHIEE